MSIIPVIVKRRKKIVEKFINTETFDAESAKPLVDLGLTLNKDIEFLLLRGTLVRTEDGTFYLDQQKKFFAI